MNKFRLYSLWVLFFVAFTMFLSSCYEIGDENVPAPRATASTRSLVGKWNVYAVQGGNFGPKLVSYDADAWVIFNADGTSKMKRYEVIYDGTWELDATGGYLNIHVDVPAHLNLEVPGLWSIQRVDSELWISTGKKHMRLKKDYSYTE